MTMELLHGTTYESFQIGGKTGNKVKTDTGVTEVRNAADNAYATARAKHILASGTTVNDLPTLRDLTARVAPIEFSFDGASPPSAGANTGKFGFVHTSGGSYTAGNIVYDDGAALTVTPTSVCKHLTTGTAITGTISLNASGFYEYRGGAWALRGDGGSTDTGQQKFIKVNYDYEDNGTPVSSTTSIPDGAVVTRVVNKVSTAFNGTTPTVAVVVDGTSDEELIATTDYDIAYADQYEDRTTHLITSGTEGVVKVTVTATDASAGAGYILVFYGTPNA